jgi:hypothetical protein
MRSACKLLSKLAARTSRHSTRRGTCRHRS